MHCFRLRMAFYFANRWKSNFSKQVASLYYRFIWGMSWPAAALSSWQVHFSRLKKVSEDFIVVKLGLHALSFSVLFKVWCWWVWSMLETLLWSIFVEDTYCIRSIRNIKAQQKWETKQNKGIHVIHFLILNLFYLTLQLCPKQTSHLKCIFWVYYVLHMIIYFSSTEESITHE